MKWIGLTGGIASGKSTASELAKGLGVPVVDADSISKQLTEKDQPGYVEIVKAFGEQVLDSSNSIDRSELGKIVFQDESKKQLLESILHPLIRHQVALVKSQLEEEGHRLAIYDVPLLFEKQLESQFDCIVLVYANENLLVQRMKQRNNWSDAEIRNRLANQVPIEEKKSKAHYVLNNEGSIDQLKQQLISTLESIKKAR